MEMFLQFLAALGSIIFVDLILSGDNALVIGAAASALAPRLRRPTLLLGGVGAVVLRILVTFFASLLLNVPFLQAVGGLVVGFIALQLLLNWKEDASSTVFDSTYAEAISKRRYFVLTVFTITIADLTMSLDNVIAVAALARGQLLLLTIGLIISIPFLFIGSAIVAELIHRLPWLIMLASFVLTWIASDLIWRDLQRISFFRNNEIYHFLSYAIPLLIMGIIVLKTRIRHFRF
ncbi:MAG: YjbE family putative metal transport protein [Ktedonobacteraceae bacterium]|nr:YjbE family putative metal transport protein [Ktedonobacteraceae bacterium]